MSFFLKIGNIKRELILPQDYPYTIVRVIKVNKAGSKLVEQVQVHQCGKHGLLLQVQL